MWHGPLRTTTPQTRINDDLMLDVCHHDILVKHQHKFVNQTFKHPLIKGFSNDKSTRYVANFLHKCFVYVITETPAEYPCQYFTEKTWKAMSSKMPFIMIGPRYNLRMLRDFGFATFDKWWSEDYDQLDTAAKRIHSATEVLKTLSNLSQDDLKKMSIDMQTVLEHNYNHMAVFVSTDLDNIQKKL